MQQPVFPSDVRIDDQAIRILWDDGHSGVYPHRYLRLRCQCAGCINEITGRPTLDPETVPQDLKAVDHMQVGNYGLQFLWSDAHYTGIYTYDFLRSACTCLTCNAGSGEDREAAN